MAAIREQVDGHAAVPIVYGAHRPKRVMSAAAKRRIAAAQRKRWAAFHADQKGGTTKTAPKRKLSGATKARFARNLAKVRASESWQGEED
jgi:hypothetical protein